MQAAKLQVTVGVNKSSQAAPTTKMVTPLLVLLVVKAMDESLCSAALSAVRWHQLRRSGFGQHRPEDEKGEDAWGKFGVGRNRLKPRCLDRGRCGAEWRLPRRYTYGKRHSAQTVLGSELLGDDEYRSEYFTSSSMGTQVAARADGTAVADVRTTLKEKMFGGDGAAIATISDTIDRIPPPPSSTSNPNDDGFRSMREKLPLSVQNWLRDSGALRFVIDTLTWLSVPMILRQHPHLLRRYLDLKVETMRYGDHPMQVMHYIEPPQSALRSVASNQGDYKDETTPRGVVFFCHGGAWGSGRPWMYRLAALPFLREGLAVAVVGYRTYPDADADGQANDLDRAIRKVAAQKPELATGAAANRVSIVGHSSGAHVGLLTLLRRVEQKVVSLTGHTVARPPPPHVMNVVNDMHLEYRGPHADKEGAGTDLDFEIDSFVGISGPYCIASHYEYERGRGVEEISPLKPACGYTTRSFRDTSPGYRFSRALAGGPPSLDRNAVVPRMLLVHGVDDDTVPYTSTVKAVEEFSSRGIDNCEGVLLNGVGHSETVLHLMKEEGETTKRVLSWLRT